MFGRGYSAQIGSSDYTFELYETLLKVNNYLAY